MGKAADKPGAGARGAGARRAGAAGGGASSAAGGAVPARTRTDAAPLDARHRIGQVLWPAVRASRGEAGLDALAPLFAEFPPGGVIVFGENVDRVDRLLAALRLRVRGDLLVSADLERGCGQQVREFSSLPPAMALAACRAPDAAQQAGLLTGLQAREAGIDVVFAPVVDVNTAVTNPIIATRSFGDDAHRVAALASAFAAGLDEGGVLAVAKHFPGHGSTVQDSHTELARVTRTREELEAVDLLPYRTLIAERIGGIMVGHLEVPALDGVPGRPATRSPNIVLELLRAQLGYDGLVITDALDMGGFPREESRAVDVLQSGLDVLLMPKDPLATARALLDAHERGWLPDEVLDAAVARVASARARVRGARTGAPGSVGAPGGAHRAGGAGRSSRGPTRRPDASLPATLLADSLTSNGTALAPLVRGVPVDVQVFGDDGTGVVVPAFLEALAAAGVPVAPGTRRIGLLLTTVRAWQGSSRLPELDRSRLRWALDHHQLQCVVILGSPYELLALPADVPGVLAYEPTPAAAVAAVRVLLGEASAPGRLPVGAAP